jgi:HK97 family phage prohead protease
MSKLDEKIASGREYRNIQFEFRALDDTDEMIVEGYATTFNDPYELYNMGDYIVMEQIDSKAFDECDMDDVIFQYNHEGRVFARTSNNTLEVVPDEKGLHIRANLGGTEIGRELYEEIKGGYTTKMSFGFRVGEDSRTVTEDYDNNVTVVLRSVTKVSKLYDVSAVSIPANSGTEISARNFADGLICEITEEFRERKKQQIRTKLRLLEG